MKILAGAVALSLSLSLLALPLAGAARAAGGGGGGGGGGSSEPAPAPSAKKLKCKRSTEVAKEIEVGGKKVWKCVKRTSDLLDDEDLYSQGRQLAKEGEYEWALDVFSTIKNQDDPRVLNYIGYSHRKAGRLETGFAYYKKALAINPDFVLAREYLGEGDVAAGRVDLARVQLAEIAARCGTSCAEYRELAKVIATASN
jgi:tetratricopeptide (TPR) repeat protein